MKRILSSCLIGILLTSSVLAESASAQVRIIFGGGDRYEWRARERERYEWRRRQREREWQRRRYDEREWRVRREYRDRDRDRDRYYYYHRR